VTDSIKLLAQGDLSGSASTLYTVTSGWMGVVKNIVLCNHDTVDRTFDFFVNGTGDSNRLCKTEPLKAGKRVILPETITLAATDTVRGNADSASKISYNIFGIETQGGTDVIKVLAQGDLSNSVGTLYTVTSLYDGVVRNIVVCNHDTVTRTFDFFVNGTADSNRLCKTVTLLAGKRMILPETITLDPGDTIRGNADSASKISYNIFGVESLA
jgi:hypothetical protein